MGNFIVKPQIEMAETIIIEGQMNYFIINALKYIFLIMSIIFLITIILRKTKNKKTSKIIIVLFIITFIITFLAFFSNMYKDVMRLILPYLEGCPTSY